MNLRERPSLSQQAVQRTLLILLISGLVISLASWLAWSWLAEQHAREESGGDIANVQFRLKSLYADWQRELDTFVAAATFHRMLESQQRWTDLRAYISSLGESLEYDGLIIRNDRKQTVFRLGRDADFLAGIPLQSWSGAWLANPAQRKLYRVIRTPLWLGAGGGQGEIVILRALDNQVLSALGNQNSRLYLTVADSVYASSFEILPSGSRSGIAGPRLNPVRPPFGDIQLGGADQILHIDHNEATILSSTQFVLTGLVLTLTLSLAFVSVFGRWLRRIVGRLHALSNAASTFKISHKLDEEVRHSLRLADGADDEVGVLRHALKSLMLASQDRDEETRAYMQTLDLIEEAVVEIGRDGLLLRSSPAWQILARPASETGSFFECFDPEDRGNLVQQIEYLFAGNKSQLTTRLRVSAPQRSGAWLEARFVPADHPVTRIRGVLRDVTQVYLQEKHITHMALHDSLTGLPNRVLLEDRLKIAARMALREHSRVGVGFIDLDHFKNINDALGHKIGDRLLSALADNVRMALRSGDTLARWGGDEFVVLLPDMQDVTDIRHVAEKLAAVSRESIRIDDNLLPVTFSMGFAVYPDDGDDVDTLLSQADRAMFYAKAQGRNTVIFYGDMAKKGLGKKELYIQTRLANAINNGLIQTWYQPLVSARSRKVVGLEALARWHDADLGWISPATFIPMAENLGLISELGELVATRALTVGRRLHDAGRNLKLAINISKRQLFLPRVTERLLEDVRNAGLEPDQLMLEITESVAMSEVEYAVDRLKALHEAGFRLSVDDFGVGYSSLSLLHEMPVNEVKIDMTFTRRALDPQGSRLIQAIIAMAQALDLTTVAEGVEDEQTAQVLMAMGIGTLQGYYFSRPLPEDEIEAWLDNHSPGTN